MLYLFLCMAYNSVGEKNMQKSAQEILSKIEKEGYEAYIVGGFVRDHCLGKKSLDVDICTSATPKELSTIFEGAVIPSITYGAVTLTYKNVKYEITTFRKETKYDAYRRPVEVQYVTSLMDDLKRRDFTINTLCMDSKGNIIDLLHAKDDLNNKIIKTVGDPQIRLKEDILRMLRAVRFATSLDFKIKDDVKEAIIDNGYLLKKLSYTRKKEELTRIFTSPNAAYGVSLIKELGLDKHLQLSNLDNLKLVDDILGIWTQLDVLDIYPFTKVEKETITKVKEALNHDIDNYALYKYGLYVISIVASIKGVDKKTINQMNASLPIKSRNEIQFNVKQFCEIYNIEPSYWLKNTYDLLEKELLSGHLENDPETINSFIANKLESILVAK